MGYLYSFWVLLVLYWVRLNNRLIIFSFLLVTCNRVRTLCKTSIFIVYRFDSERKRLIVIEQTRFLSTVFLCSEFKLEK